MTPSRWLLLVLATVVFAACLQGERLETPVRDCSCYGLRCVDGEVARLSPRNDDEPCLCHVDAIGMCAQGCGESRAAFAGCLIGAVCKSWDRVAEGTLCTTDRDCEPGELRERVPVPLTCQNGSCTANADKWGSQTIPAKQCQGDPEYGPHPACDGTPCMPIDDLHSKRVCSVARCLDDRDCPSLWKCRCAEEMDESGGLIAHRWCVPDLEGGYPDNLIAPL